MSEYQYYEFQAIDRRLTAGEMARLRSFSTRAKITPTSFVNEYQWGDFRGDEDAWMNDYFDAFLYFANWGTRILKLRLSSRLLDGRTASPYCAGESVSVREHDGRTIITFSSEAHAEDSEWPDETDALSALIPIRAQLARGDLRSLYIGWLLSAQSGELADEEIEPPVPPGLGDLDGSLERLVDFLGVDQDLLDVAAATSPPLTEQSLSRKAIQTWIAGRPPAEKDDYLERFISAGEPSLAAELQHLIGNRIGALAVSGTPRTVSSLLRAAEDAANERKRAREEKAAKDRARREREAALARSKYLDDLARREPAVWKEIDALIATTQPSGYDRAIGLLVDLRDVAAAQGSASKFSDRLDALRTAHARKPSLISRMQRAGL